MSLVGQVLVSPETGWKRYDDTYPTFVYEGSFTRQSITQAYNGHRTGSNVGTLGKTKFNFIGTSLRILGTCYEGYSPEVAIVIDGEQEVVSAKTDSIDYKYTTVLYERTGLANTIHVVEVYPLAAGTQDYDYMLEAVDISAAGRLLHPDEVTEVTSLAIGKRVRCRYAAKGNFAGVFTNIGKETYVDGINDFINPSSPTANPRGDFYLIAVDKDKDDNFILVADRNIQSNISWDQLNTDGIASGKTIKLFGWNPGDCYTSFDVTNQGFGAVLRGGSDPMDEGFLRATKGITQGKYYWEVEIIGLSGNHALMLGVGTKEAKSYRSDSTRIYHMNDGNKWPENVSWGDPYRYVGAVIGVRLDMDEGTIGFSLDGVDQGISHSDLLTLGKVYPYLSIGTSLSSTVTVYANFGQSEFKYEVPEGYAPYSDLVEGPEMFARLMTGGASSSDIDNEWNTYIVESDLGGSIIPGDNGVWNWSQIASRTSSTPVNNSTRRVYRGREFLDYFNNAGSNHTASSVGFRPLIHLTVPAIPPSFVGSPDRDSFHKENVILSGYIEHPDPLKYKIQANGQDITSFSDFSVPPIDIEISLSHDVFNVGGNLITIVTQDEEGRSYNIDFAVTKTNLEPYGTFQISCEEVTRQNIVLRGIVSNLPEGYALREDWDYYGEVFYKPIDVTKFEGR